MQYQDLGVCAKTEGCVGGIVAQESWNQVSSVSDVSLGVSADTVQLGRLTLGFTSPSLIQNKTLCS